MPPLLTTGEVAELLRLSNRSVLAMVRSGTLRAHRSAGHRRYHFLAEDVLAAVTGREPDDAAPSAVAGEDRVPVAPADPCEVWGPAPLRDGDDWGQRCLDRWVAMASAAGLDAVIDVDDAAVDARAVGVVDVEGLRYQVLAGPRQRVRCLDDDGEQAWTLLDSIWVDPLG